MPHRRNRGVMEDRKDNLMQLTLQTYLIACPLVFLAGFVDAIGGGGGLISLPAYLIAGLPVHNAIATNKLSSACGTTLATLRFIKNKLVYWPLAIPSIVCAMAGSSMGAQISMRVDSKVMTYVLYAVLPVAALIVLNRHIFKDNEENELTFNKKTFIVTCLAALIVGFYDGFYGPGTGTFLIIAFTVFAKMSMKQANGQAKVINLTTNITSLAIFFLNGQVLIPIGIAAAICNMVGGWLGAGMVMSQGGKIVRPIILLVLALLFVKIITG